MRDLHGLLLSYDRLFGTEDAKKSESVITELSQLPKVIHDAFGTITMGGQRVQVIGARETARSSTS